MSLSNLVSGVEVSPEWVPQSVGIGSTWRSADGSHLDQRWADFNA